MNFYKKQTGAQQWKFVHEQVDAFIREHVGMCEDVEILRSEQNCSLMLVCGTCHPELLALVLRLLEVDPFSSRRASFSAKRKHGVDSHGSQSGQG